MECFSKFYVFYQDRISLSSAMILSLPLKIVGNNNNKNILFTWMQFSTICWKLEKWAAQLECAFLLNPQVDSKTTIDTYFDLLLLFSCFLKSHQMLALHFLLFTLPMALGLSRLNYEYLYLLIPFTCICLFQILTLLGYCKSIPGI